MNETKQRLRDRIQRSPFQRASNHRFNINFKDLFGLPGELTKQNESINPSCLINATPYEIISKLTPAFHKKNNKWSQEMQIDFIENILSGCDSTILLYNIIDSDTFDCKIIKGYQQLFAIASFQSGDFPIFKNLFWDDIRHERYFPRLNFSISVLGFDSDKQACEFYIQINKNNNTKAELKNAYVFIDSESNQ